MKSSQTHLWITLIVILLIVSVGFNLYFIIKSHKTTKNISNLVAAYGKELSGDMIGLTELLYKAKENGRNLIVTLSHQDKMWKELNKFNPKWINDNRIRVWREIQIFDTIKLHSESAVEFALKD